MNKNTYILLFIVVIQFLVFSTLNGFGVLSTDDIYTLHTTALSLTEAFKAALYFEQQAPLYFILMTLWREISTSLAWAKLFHYMTIAIGTVYFYKIFKLLIPDERDVFIFLLFFALHPFIFLISNDLRRYSLTLLFSTITIYYYVKIYFHEEKTFNNYLLLVIFSVVGVLNDYYHSFLLISLGIGVFFTKGKAKWSYFLCMIPPVFVFLFLLRTLFYQLDNSGNWAIEYIGLNNIYTTAAGYVLFLLENQTYLINYFDLNSLFNWVFRLLLFVSILLFIRMEYIKKFKVFFIASIFFLIIYLTIIYVLKSTDFLLVRYMGFSFPLFIIVFGLLIRQPIKNNYLKFIFIGYFIIAFVFSYYEIYQVKYTFQKSIKKIALKVEKDFEKSPVLVLNPKYSEAIKFYLKDRNIQVIGMPGELNFNVYDYGSRSIESKEQLDTIFESIKKNHTNFQIIINDNELKNNSYNSHVLIEYLNENFQLLTRNDYDNFLIFDYEHTDE